MQVTRRHIERLRHDDERPTQLYLVRHGQTAGNVAHQLIGHSDIPLDDLGHQQASQVAAHLKAISLDRVLSSPLQRARATAEAIARYHGLDPVIDARLREMHFGHAEGLTIHEAAARLPELRRLAAHPLDNTFQWPGGDHRATFHAEVFATFTEIAAAHAGSHVAVVCHGGVLTSLLAQLDGGSPNDYARYPVPNCSVTHLEVGRLGSILHRVNDIAHLDVVRTEPFTYTIPGATDVTAPEGDDAAP